MSFIVFDLTCHNDGSCSQIFNFHGDNPMSKHFFAFLVAVVVCSSAALAEELRTWTDSSGAFTIEASLVSFDGKTVTLKKEDGKTLSLSIDKLSDEDQRYLTEGPSSENPFEAAERAAARAQGAPGAPPPTSTAKTVNLDSAKEIGDYGETSWTCAPDPSPLENLPAKNSRSGPAKFPFTPTRKTMVSFSAVTEKKCSTLSRFRNRPSVQKREMLTRQEFFSAMSLRATQAWCATRCV